MSDRETNSLKNKCVFSPKNLGLLFILSLFVITLLLPLFQKGTFIDGMLYKTVGFNYARGSGTFWTMKFTETCMRFFCEQPPLYFYVLGNFYRIFGESHMADRLFTLLLFFLLSLTLSGIVKNLVKRHSFYFLLLQFFLLSIPVFCWSYANQVIETLLCFLTAAAILAFVRYIKTSKMYYSHIFSAILILLFLTKGFQSCFLIALPFSYYAISVFKKNRSRRYGNTPGRESKSRSHSVPVAIGIVSESQMLKQVQHDDVVSVRAESSTEHPKTYLFASDSYRATLNANKRPLYFAILSGILVASFILLTINYYGPAATWFDCYYQARLVLTMQNIGNTTDNHFEIIGRFFSELLVCFIVIGLLFFYIRRNKNHSLKLMVRYFYSNKMATALLITSLAGSFPYALSLVQRGFYLLPAFICFCLAVVIGLKRYWLFLFKGWNYVSAGKAARISIPLVFIFSVVYFILNVNTFKRDEALAADVETIAPYLDEGDSVRIEDDLWNYVSLHALLYTNKHVSLLAEDRGQEFMITHKSGRTDVLKNSYSKLDLKTKELDLWIRLDSKSIYWSDK